MLSAKGNWRPVYKEVFTEGLKSAGSCLQTSHTEGPPYGGSLNPALLWEAAMSEHSGKLRALSQKRF